MDIESADGRQSDPVILVGYSAAWLAALAKFQPEHTLVLVDEPDIVRKRGVRAAADASTVVRELVEWEYQLDGAADSFHQAHRHLRPVAVVPVSDYGVPFAARLAERYGVVGAGFGAAVLLRDKQQLRAVTAAAGIPNPLSVPVHGPADVRAVLAAAGGPIVLKPANRQGTIGTKILHDPAEVDAAWVECVDQDEGIFGTDRLMPSRMLAERYLRGDEYSVEMMVRGGRPFFASVTRKHLFDGPRPVERGHQVPSGAAAALDERLIADTTRVADAVGLDTAFVHCEWIVEDGVPHLVECAGRLAGGGIMDLIVMAWEYDVFGQYWAMMHGSELYPPPTAPTVSAAVWLSHGPVGEVERVTGVAAAQASPGVRGCPVGVAPGQRIDELRSSWDRIGMVMAVGATPAEALANARHAIGRIEITVRGPAVRHLAEPVDRPAARPA